MSWVRQAVYVLGRASQVDAHSPVLTMFCVPSGLLTAAVRSGRLGCVAGDGGVQCSLCFVQSCTLRPNDIVKTCSLTPDQASDRCPTRGRQVKCVSDGSDRCQTGSVRWVSAGSNRCQIGQMGVGEEVSDTIQMGQIGVRWDRTCQIRSAYIIGSQPSPTPCS